MGSTIKSDIVGKFKPRVYALNVKYGSFDGSHSKTIGIFEHSQDAESIKTKFESEVKSIIDECPSHDFIECGDYKCEQCLKQSNYELEHEIALNDAVFSVVPIILNEVTIKL